MEAVGTRDPRPERALRLQPLRDAAEQGLRQARRPLGAPIATFSAADLEVHSVDPGTYALPGHIVRAHDHVLDELIADPHTCPAR